MHYFLVFELDFRDSPFNQFYKLNHYCGCLSTRSLKLTHASNFCQNIILCEKYIYIVKPFYVEHVDKWFLKIYLFKLYRTNFKNQLSTYSTQRGFTVSENSFIKKKKENRITAKQQYSECEQCLKVSLHLISDAQYEIDKYGHKNETEVT